MNKRLWTSYLLLGDIRRMIFRLWDFMRPNPTNGHDGIHLIPIHILIVVLPAFVLFAFLSTLLDLASHHIISTECTMVSSIIILPIHYFLEKGMSNYGGTNLSQPKLFHNPMGVVTLKHPITYKVGRRLWIGLDWPLALNSRNPIHIFYTVINQTVHEEFRKLAHLQASIYRLQNAKYKNSLPCLSWVYRVACGKTSR